MGMRLSYKQTRWFQAVLVGLLAWLAHGIFAQIADVTYAVPAQGQADRKSVVIDRPPVRFIKDPNPSLRIVKISAVSFRRPRDQGRECRINAD